jgi:hypothetical protein
MGERHSSIRGLFAVTESGGKHAPCCLPINAVADDRSFVALQASGSDDMQERRELQGRLPNAREDAEAAPC